MAIPFIKDFDFTYGVPTALSPLITRIICENPGPFTFTGSGTYIIGSDKVALIDPGPVNDQHQKKLLAYLADKELTHILITHTHSDHCGGAKALSEATNAPIYAYSNHPTPQGHAAPALDEGADFGFRADYVLKDNEIICGPDWTLRAIFTPGHIANHLCFALQEANALFTGDHIMGWATTVVAPPDGDMEEYLQSLDLLIARHDEVYYPTHGAPILSPQIFTQEVKKHRLLRDAQILAELKNGSTQIMEIVKTIYRDVDPRLHIAAALNVEAHLARHVRSGDITQIGDSIMDAVYTLNE